MPSPDTQKRGDPPPTDPSMRAPGALRGGSRTGS